MFKIFQIFNDGESNSYIKIPIPYFFEILYLIASTSANYRWLIAPYKARLEAFPPKFKLIFKRIFLRR